MDQQLLRDIVQWDVRNWAKALAFWESAVDWIGVRGPCLEIGAREGGLSLWLALKNKQVVCSDLRQTEIRASKLHQQYNVCAQVRYLDLDATNIPFENHFDIVVFKSVLGSLGFSDVEDKQRKVMSEIFKSLKPGGKLLFAENLYATPVHDWLRKHVVRDYACKWRYATVQDMHSYLRPFSAYELRTTGFISLFGRTETQRNLLALADQTVFEMIIPKTWKYIAYGVATK